LRQHLRDAGESSADYVAHATKVLESFDHGILDTDRGAEALRALDASLADPVSWDSWLNTGLQSAHTTEASPPIVGPLPREKGRSDAVAQEGRMVMTTATQLMEMAMLGSGTATERRTLEVVGR